MEIKISDLEKNYGKIRVLRGINFTLKEGSVLGLIGPNGVGKSTLLRLLAGVLLPNKGSICCDSIANYESWAHRNTMFIPTGERGLKNKLNTYENAMYFGSLKGINNKKIKKQLEKYSKIMNFDDLLFIKFERLSTGQKKKAVLLVGAILCKSLLLLDEPSNGLDISSRNDLINYIRNEKKSCKTTVISSHDPGILSQVVDHYIFLKEGLIFKEIEGQIDEKKFIEIYHSYYE
ncbi:ATP-binding cassette domain-containing protein [Ligilactobacillus apodemi]|uniref:ATP-binding cassette domain-containing protein n=1 Tax=Ligilactobacillus apodemi TaxID=307126 RepID=UPI00214BA5EF|nr:ATP-binding cassette domain-containing protein [Ligilactobacillus apodemi]MCR1901406.1 ATP-binding cassette domain-containing protein [Ligilactobacillus apodemi]